METNSKQPSSNKKYLEPTFHFIRKRILTGEDERVEKIMVSELVKKDQLLLSFPDFENFSEKGFEKSPVRSGKNTRFSEDGETLLADTIGYPRVDTMNQKDTEEPILLVSINPFVKISDDCMEATLILHPPVPGGFTPRPELLPELLEEAGILFGIDQHALQQAQKIISAGYNDYHNIPIAYGQTSEAGEDAYLKFAFEIGPIPGHLMKDGTIDFRERRIMIDVAKDELIATKIPAVPGIPGVNVLGREIEPEGGSELEIKISEDTAFYEKTGEVKATEDGILTVVNDCEIKVCAKQDIQGDINYDTGNINSGNCVTVHGAVQPGFKVLTGGDLEIGKEVMSATLKSGGNIVIKGGITGEKTSIKALGDVDIIFIEQGHIESGGNVVIRKQSYYSDISAKGDIRCQIGTTIVGGEIIAGGQLTVANVGSENGQPALLAAGVDFDRLKLQAELTEDLSRQQDEIIQWLQRHGGNTRPRKIKKMEARADKTKMKLLKLNLIPGTAQYSRVGALKKMATEENDSDVISTKAISIDKIYIDIHGTIFAGTELKIGNCRMLLQKNICNRRMKLKKNLKQIIATPLK